MALTLYQNREVSTSTAQLLSNEAPAATATAASAARRSAGLIDKVCVGYQVGLAFDRPTPPAPVNLDGKCDAVTSWGGIN